MDKGKVKFINLMLKFGKPKPIKTYTREELLKIYPQSDITNIKHLQQLKNKIDFKRMELVRAVQEWNELMKESNELYPKQSFLKKLLSWWRK